MPRSSMPLALGILDGPLFSGQISHHECCISYLLFLGECSPKVSTEHPKPNVWPRSNCPQVFEVRSTGRYYSRGLLTNLVSNPIERATNCSRCSVSILLNENEDKPTNLPEEQSGEKKQFPIPTTRSRSHSPSYGSCAGLLD